MDDRRMLNLWRMGPFPAITPSSGFSSLAVTAFKIGDLPSSLVPLGAPSLAGGSLHRSHSSSSLAEFDSKLFGTAGQGSGFSQGFSSAHGSRTPPPHHSPNGKKPAKVCGVCGDRAKSYHFGGISCDSCKAFFRRSVQNEAYKNFQCPYEGKCDITITSRKCCQFCRFRKCNEIGMEKGWVMTEEERTQLLKSRLERKQRLLLAKSSPNILTPEPTTPSPCGLLVDLSPEDVTLIEELLNSYLQCSYRLGLLQSRHMVTRSYVLNLLFSAIKQLLNFCEKLSSFQAIPILADRETLLKTSVYEMMFLRSAYAYDDRLKGWVLSREKTSQQTDEALVYFEDVHELINDDLLIEKHKRFVKSMRQAVPDHDNVIYTILMAISLHCGDRKGLLDNSHISQEQEKYILLLQRYLRYRYPEMSKAIYARILLKLPDLREVAEAHHEFPLKITDEESKQIQERLAQLEQIEVPSSSCAIWKFHENVPMAPSSTTKDE